jgi:HK97 family phage major capsid protein
MNESILDKRNNVLAKMRDISSKAEAESRALTGEETTSFKAMEKEFNGYQDTLDIQNKQREIDARDSAPTSEPVAHQPGGRVDAAGNLRPVGGRAIMDAYGRALADSIKGVDPTAPFTSEHRAILHASLERGDDSAGGYLVPPQEFVSQLIKKIDDLTFIRQKATTYTLTSAKSLGVPTLETDPNDADWTPEVGTVTEDTAMTFGKRELNPNQLSKEILVALRLLDTGVIPVEQLVLERMAHKFAITEEKHYLTGSGASQPLGLFTASPDGISTGRDISTGMTTTAITADGLINVKYSLKGQYQSQAEWLFHRDAMLQIALLKDSQNRYLFIESLRADEPDRLLGRPLMNSEYVPNTFTTGLYVGMLGVFSHYWIVDSLSMQMQRHDLEIRKNKVGFIGRKETDGMPVLEEAFSRITLA